MSMSTLYHSAVKRGIPRGAGGIRVIAYLGEMTEIAQQTRGIDPMLV